MSDPDSSFRFYNDISRKFMKRDYLLPGQTLTERVAIIAATAERRSGIKGFAERVTGHVQKAWWSFSTPVWTNYGTDRGLPISCFGTHIGDSIASIMEGHAEVGMMSKYGGGTSSYWGSVRPQGSVITNNGNASGPLHYLKMFETLLKTVTQGATRNSSMAAYMDIDHPDIEDFLTIRDLASDLQEISPAVCVPDQWMKEMIGGDAAKRGIQAKILTSRGNTGFPYIFYTDNVQRNLPDVYRDRGMQVRHSNLCTEILLPTDEDESFVCCLSSMNLAYYDEWKDTEAVEDMVIFLDTVLDEFIEKAKSLYGMKRAARFAERHRALGIGVLGWHTLLQKRDLPFESMEAKLLNAALFKDLKKKAYAASAEMAERLGESEICKGYGRRHATLLAIAPTVSSSTIIGQPSPGIEPYLDNYTIHDKAKLKYSFRNPQFGEVLEAYGRNEEKVWEAVLHERGSAQHLDFLSDHHKAVYKTSLEIAPIEIIIQAHQRQKDLDQGQSLNLVIHPSMSDKERNALLIKAWELGVCTLYYQINVSAAQEFSRSLTECKSCQ